MRGGKLSTRQREALRIIAQGRFYPDISREDDGWHARWRAFGDADDTWVDEYVRSFAMTPLSADAEDRRHETLHDAWMDALRSRTGLVRWDGGECAAFAKDLAEWHGGGEEDTTNVSEDFFKDLTGKLQELMNAMTGGDSILIGDLMEYEFVPALEDIKAFLNNQIQ